MLLLSWNYGIDIAWFNLGGRLFVTINRFLDSIQIVILWLFPFFSFLLLLSLSRGEANHLAFPSGLSAIIDKLSETESYPNIWARMTKISFCLEMIECERPKSPLSKKILQLHALPKTLNLPSYLSSEQSGVNKSYPSLRLNGIDRRT